MAEAPRRCMAHGIPLLVGVLTASAAGAQVSKLKVTEVRHNRIDVEYAPMYGDSTPRFYCHGWRERGRSDDHTAYRIPLRLSGDESRCATGV